MRSITMSAALLCLASGCAHEESSRTPDVANAPEVPGRATAKAGGTAAGTSRAIDAPEPTTATAARGVRDDNDPTNAYADADSAEAASALGAAQAVDASGLMGIWRVTNAIRPAWRDAEAEPAPGWVGSTIMFEDTQVRGPAPLSCSRARYAIALLPVEGLFQGTLAELPDASEQTRALDLDTAGTPTLQLSCDSGVFDLHRDAHGRLLVMLDHVIYVLERDAATPAGS